VINFFSTIYKGIEGDEVGEGAVPKPKYPPELKPEMNQVRLSGSAR